MTTRNDGQHTFWNTGPGWQNWARQAGELDTLNAATTGPLLEALAPRPGEAILDAGCGAGASCLALAPLLLPGGSGRPGDDVLAQNLENAARLAISDLDGVNIDLRIYNTGDSASQSAAAAVQAVNDGAKIILGPVFADAANAAGSFTTTSGCQSRTAFSTPSSIAGASTAPKSLGKV